MTAPASLDLMLDARQVWRGQVTSVKTTARHPTEIAALDAQLPWGGWPPAALSEVLVPGDGMGELTLVWPALAALTRARKRIILIAPPYRPHAPAWAKAGVALDYLQVVQAKSHDVLWAAEQCLRSSACGAVLCWPSKADDRALRRLQNAAETGQCLGFVYRDAREACNPSPAALRLLVGDGEIRVLKCKGGTAPAQPFALAG